ncbi:hypothetical protein OQA88_4614 [Cercophora sp. LCS_1]
MNIAKFKLLWLLVWAVVGVFSYDLYGGYERVIYYNAYRMDWGKSGGDATRMTIGSGCRKGTTACNFLEFVQYINKGGKMPVLDMKNAPRDWDPVNMKKEHVDWAAKALRDADATGIYEANKIYKGLGRNDVDGLFRKVGGFIFGARGASNVPANSIECAEAAVDVWADLRKEARKLAFMDHLNEKYKDKNLKLEPVDKPIGNAGVKIQTFDQVASFPKIRALPGMSKYTYTADFTAYVEADPGHGNKVQLANDVNKAIKGEAFTC